MPYDYYYYIPEMTLWQEFWYELRLYFGVGSTSINLAVIVWVSYIGLIASFIFVRYQKRTVGKFVRALNSKANCAETAVTFAELGYSKAVHIKRLLTTKSQLTGLVYMVGEDARDENGELVPTLRSKVDWATAKFYIPAERKYRVEVKFEKEGTHFGWIILTAIIFFFVAVFAVRWLPDFFEFLRGLLPERTEPWHR